MILELIERVPQCIVMFFKARAKLGLAESQEAALQRPVCAAYAELNVCQCTLQAAFELTKEGETTKL